MCGWEGGRHRVTVPPPFREEFRTGLHGAAAVASEWCQRIIRYRQTVGEEGFSLVAVRTLPSLRCPSLMFGGLYEGIVV